MVQAELIGQSEADCEAEAEAFTRSNGEFVSLPILSEFNFIIIFVLIRLPYGSKGAKRPRKLYRSCSIIWKSAVFSFLACFPLYRLRILCFAGLIRLCFGSGLGYDSYAGPADPRFQTLGSV